MSDTAALPIWNCQFNKDTEPNAAELNTLTVGAKFNLACHGDIEVAWNDGPLKVNFAKADDAYSLAVLKAEKLEPREAILTVTGYKPGKHNPDYIRITQGANGFEIAKPTWEIQSVIKKDQQQPPQPFPPFGPWNLPFPIWILVTVAVVILLIGFAIFRIVRRYSQRNRMLADLARHKTALSPINQFYRDARVLRRRLNEVKSDLELRAVSDDLNREFRMYVLREFLIPTMDWSDGAIVDDLRRRHRTVYDGAGDALKRMLRELTRMRANPSLQQKDVEQLHRMSLDAAERIEGAKR